MKELLLPALHLGSLLAFLAYVLRKPFRFFIEGRHAYFRDEIARVQRELFEAQQKYEEYSAHLKMLDSEVENIRTEVHDELNRSKEKILSGARQMAESSVKEAHRNAELILREMHAELLSELVDKVMDLAEEDVRSRLRVEEKAKINQEATQLVENAIDQMSGLSA